MSQRKEINELLIEILPYISHVEEIKELFNRVNSLEELKEIVSERLKEEKDITKITDYKIILNKISEIMG
ncbi:hypothetical protein [Methanocaldococcus infernus]